MTTLSQRLRQKLLDLAIRGKLVPQDAHDEPADELLARIRKARSTQKGRARTLTAPLPVTDDEQPFDLPKGWTWCRLGDIADVQLGKMLDAEKNKGRSFRYLANVSVRWGSFVLANLKTTLFADDEVERFALRPNDLLMCEGGVPGRCAIWREQNSDVKYQKALHRIRFTECLPDFYQIYFEAIHKSGFFVERFTGSTIHHLPREVLFGVPIPLPPLAEQRRIVAALDGMLAAADAVASGTKKIATLKEKVRAKILDLAIRGKLVKQDCNDEPASELLARIRNEELEIRNGRARRSATAEPIPDDEKPFDLPKGWAWCRVGDVIDLLSGQDFPPCRYNDDGVGVPYITGASNFGSGGIIENRWTDTPTVIAVKGDFLLTCKGSGVGKTAVMDLPKGHIARQIMALRPCAGLTDKYLATYMQANFSLLRQSANGLIPGIQRSVVLEMVMPLPPLAEQKRIVAKVDEMLAACEELGMRN